MADAFGRVPGFVRRVVRRRHADFQGIVRQRLDETRWLLAVNGHALIAEDRADWRRLWSWLCEGEARRVDALAGRGRGAAALREWLEALQTLGGLQQDEAR